jgi:hypothetical protein
VNHLVLQKFTSHAPWLTFPADKTHQTDIYIALHCIAVVAIHRVNRFGELGVVPLVNAAAVNPEILCVITRCLLATEHNVAPHCLSRSPDTSRNSFP